MIENLAVWFASLDPAFANALGESFVKTASPQKREKARLRVGTALERAIEIRKARVLV